MAPRPGKGIVKSGNAGNASKDSTKPTVSATSSSEDKPLFPPGSKYPLSLLHERFVESSPCMPHPCVSLGIQFGYYMSDGCQKNGWEKPVVDTRKHGEGWTFSVSLSRINKKTSQRESVRFEPHPPYTRPTALEARHWGATYALYRFCNGIQLNRVLPPGPREYWSDLASQHKTAPEHQRWMYDADPFAAQKEVEKRQKKGAQIKEQRALGFQGDTHKPSTSPEFTRVPEVRMSSTLRDLVEDTGSVFFSSHETWPLALDQDDVPALTWQLGQLGFQPMQVQNTMSYLSMPSPLGSHLLGSLAPLDACIEYLLLHIAETDLPDRFFSPSNSSNPFIVSGHSGTENLKKRWIEDIAIKEAGFPAHIVKEHTANSRLAGDLILLISALSRRLIGRDTGRLFAGSANLVLSCLGIRDQADEVEALGAHFVDSNHIIMPLFSGPVQLHVILPPGTCEDNSPLAVYVGSHSVPPYIRLHLLAQFLCAVEQDDFVGPGEGFLIAAMRALEDCWAQVETNGPPDMLTVVGCLMLPRTPPRGPDVPYDASNDKETRRVMHGRMKHNDDRSDEQVKQDFEKNCNTRVYAEMLASRQRLPSFSVKDQFLGILDKHRTVVVVGETGCGKTTQLPQFILDSLILNGRGSRASIIVTQPRRISAVSVAARVSGERADDGSVGYAIRGDTKQDKGTKLLYCTTGVLLRRLGSGDMLENTTHVVVDEVHERSVDGDFLLLELRELLSRHDTLKVVLMSATINHETFVKFFNDAPLLTIPGFTHPVKDRYLEDFIDTLSYTPKGSKRGGAKGQRDKEYEDTLRSQGVSERGMISVRNIISADRIDYQMIACLVEYIISSAGNPAGILIFLPGVQEIRQCITAISGSVTTNDVDIYPLHANLTSGEQCAVFKMSKKWKVIVATNVAETSITVDDVVYVIDSGKVKETKYNSDTGLTILKEKWITRASARQRRGRAGRTKPGICYKLYTQKQEEDMDPFPIPEMLRIPLESISLMVKATREGEDVQYFLKKAIDPPDTSAMNKAWLTLQELGAIDKENKLTALGRHMAMLPLDPRLGKMLVLGLTFRCLNPVLTIVASLSSKPLFTSPLEKREAATEARFRFDKHHSDLLTDVHAYRECMRLLSEDKSRGVWRSFCEENFISMDAVHEITSLRQDFFSSLLSMGLTAASSTPDSPALNVNSTNTNLIKAVILGGLWPRVAQVHLPLSAIKFDKVQAGTVQRENTAKEYKMYDVKHGRVFLHPTSVLFGESTWKSPFVAYFQMQQTTKLFMRGATEVPMYALLLFGGPVSVNHVGGGLVVGTGDSTIKLKAWPRIGVLVNQLRRLVEVQLQESIEEGLMLGTEKNSMVLNAIRALLEYDGLTN